MTSEQQTAGRGIFNLDWYTSLVGNARHAFWAGAAGWTLDAFDLIALTLALSAIGSTFGASEGQMGLVVTVTLVVSALGGISAGILADRIGRVRTLMLTVAVYSVFAFLSGFAQNYEQLLVLRALQGFGLGGEWAAGAILVAEMANSEQRGRVLGALQSFWAIGWGLCAIVYTIIFSLAEPDLAWRILFWTGILPALLILYIRARVQEPEVYQETRRAEREERREAVERGATENPLWQIFRSDLIGKTLAASLLATGIQGGYYAMLTWTPTYLAEERGLTVVGTGSYLLVVIGGSFIGYVTSGYINDWLGRKKTFALYAVGGGISLFLYTQIPQGGNAVLLILGVPLGFFASGAFSGFGSYLAELFPSRARGAGQGFTYNVGRAIGAFFPYMIGVLAASIGLTAAILFGIVAYCLALVSLLFLPETRGKQLVVLD
jgi:MFS family permease